MPAGLIGTRLPDPKVAKAFVTVRIPRMPSAGVAWTRAFKNLAREGGLARVLLRGGDARTVASVKTALRASVVSAAKFAAARAAVVGVALRVAHDAVRWFVRTGLRLGDPILTKFAGAVADLGLAVAAEVGPPLERAVLGLSGAILRVSAAGRHLGPLLDALVRVAAARLLPGATQLRVPDVARVRAAHRRFVDPVTLPSGEVRQVIIGGIGGGTETFTGPSTERVAGEGTPTIPTPEVVAAAAEIEPPDLREAQAALARVMADIEAEVEVQRAKVQETMIGGYARQLDEVARSSAWDEIAGSASEIMGSLQGAVRVGLRAAGRLLEGYRTSVGGATEAALAGSRVAVESLNDAIQMDLNVVQATSDSVRVLKLQAAVKLAILAVVAIAGGIRDTVLGVAAAVTGNFVDAALHFAAAGLHFAAAALAGAAGGSFRSEVADARDAVADRLARGEEGSVATLTVRVPGYSGPDDIRGYVERALGAEAARG